MIFKKTTKPIQQKLFKFQKNNVRLDASLIITAAAANKEEITIFDLTDENLADDFTAVYIPLHSTDQRNSSCWTPQGQAPGNDHSTEMENLLLASFDLSKALQETEDFFEADNSTSAFFASLAMQIPSPSPFPFPSTGPSLSSKGCKKEEKAMETVPLPKLEEKDISATFDVEEAVLRCSLGEFQHLQYLLPEHPYVLDTLAGNTKWFRMNGILKNSLDESFYLTLSSTQRPELYKLVKQSGLFKQSNALILLKRDAREQISAVLLDKFNNRKGKRNSSTKSKEKSRKKSCDNKSPRKSSASAPSADSSAQDKAKKRKQEEIYDFSLVKKSRQEAEEEKSSVLSLVDNNTGKCASIVVCSGSEQEVSLAVKWSASRLVNSVKCLPILNLTPSPISFFNSSQLNSLESISSRNSFLHALQLSKLTSRGVSSVNSKKELAEFAEFFLAVPNKLGRSDCASTFEQLVQKFLLLSLKLPQVPTRVILTSNSLQISLAISESLCTLVSEWVSLHKSLQRVCGDESLLSMSSGCDELFVQKKKVSAEIRRQFISILKTVFGDNWQAIFSEEIFFEECVPSACWRSCLRICERECDLVGVWRKQGSQCVTDHCQLVESASKEAIPLLRSLLADESTLICEIEWLVDEEGKLYLRELSFSPSELSQSLLGCDRRSTLLVDTLSLKGDHTSFLVNNASSFSSIFSPPNSSVNILSARFVNEFTLVQFCLQVPHPSILSSASFEFANLLISKF